MKITIKLSYLQRQRNETRKYLCCPLSRSLDREIFPKNMLADERESSAAVISALIIQMRSRRLLAYTRISYPAVENPFNPMKITQHSLHLLYVCPRLLLCDFRPTTAA